jgi:hypothetical protein
MGMPATPLSQSEITVKGPFWTARARVVTSPYLTPTGSTWGGADIPDVRAIFVEDEARAAFGFERVHLPGTLVALCYVESVTIQPDQGSGPSYQWQRRHDESVPRVESIEQMKGLLYGDEGRQAGQLSLLLLETDPDQVADVTFTCTAGEINLGVLQPQTNALKRLYRALDLEPVEGDGEESRWTAAVHSSGLSIYGKAELPWLSKDVGIAAPFQLARGWPDPATGGRNRRAGFRLTVEADRLTNSEAEALVAAWQTLSRYLSPRHPLVGDPNSPQQTPTWVTLETANPLVLPRLYWEIAPWQAEPESWPLHFERGQFIILLADQQPHDLNHRPTSLAQMVPDDVLITSDREKGLEIAVQAGPQVDQADRRLNYQWHREPSQEVCAFSGVEVAYNPTETPEFVRETQNLPIPEWLPGDQPATIKPAVVWGFMPLEDGWAQLPIPNLTEQVYLDAKVSNIGKEAEEKGSTLLRGAVSLGNEPALMWHRDEQPWNVTLVNLARAQGVWQLKADPDTGGLALEAIDLELSNPKLILNGLFWLGSGKPRVEDALPDLADWISGLQSVSLATMSDTDLFPPIVKLVLDDFSISSREREASSTEAASAVLTAWSFTYTVSQGLLSRMIDARVLPQKVFGQHPPLVWRRHPTLPMIQALPLTQSKLPPNYPNASRQLAPFELPLTAEGDDSVPLPTNWRFGVRGSNGAAQWPKLLDQVSPAVEWVSHSDLPLAALSLPGLTLAPTLSSEDVGLAEDPGMPLVVQYRFDLPYTDQLNALAQLPKVLGETEGPPPEPPKPLTRETLTEHWQTLSTRASLASADAIEAFSRHNGRDFILHLVEPYRWPVRPTLSLATYPGALAIENTNGDSPASITLEADVALKGISGTFTLEGEPGHLQRLGDRYNGNGLDYLVEAGSMAAHYDEERLSMRDQRGLMRQATGQTDGWLRTPVQLHRELDNIDSYELVSALQPVALRVTEEETWQFWVRDLPVEQASASFLRDRVRSSQAQDVNDPEALSREYNFLSGYEWRLGQDKAPHKLYGLDFYPLTLERATFKDDRLERVEIIGRLQLPLSNAQELEHLSNAVRVVFTAEAEEDWLRLSGVELETPIGEWPLVSTEGEAPRLEWKKISLNEDLKQLEVNLVWLRFFLFDVEWSLRLDSLVFGNGIDTAIEETYAFDADASRALYPEEATLQIDLKDRQHRLELRMVVQLGEHRVDDGLLVHYEFEAGEDAAMVYDVSGVGEPLNLTVQDPDAVSWLPGSGLAIHNPTRLISDGPATKIIDAVQASDEISIEAWIKPASTSLSEPQVPARIVTLSSTIKERNFSLQQGAWPQPEGDFYHVRLRTSEVQPDQEVPVATPLGSLTMELTHVVYTRDAGGVARLYLDGVQVVSQAVPGDLDNWNADFPLVLANELTDGRAWLGEFYQVSIYERALFPSEVSRNFQQGVPGGSSPPAARLEAILPLDIGVSIFDSPVARTWPRLDPISLEENWFRLQNPVEEAQPAGVQSVTAARPTTPARLSRATALRRAFNAFRRVYPPARPNGELPAAPSEGLMVWRQNRLMVMQGAPTSLGSSAPPYGWHLTGLLIRGSHLSHRSESAVLRRYPAATLLPALLEVDGRENPLPVSFAVSPYLGLEYKAGQEGSPQLVSVELMCVDHVSGQLRPVASRFVSFDGRTGEGNLEKVQGLNMSWAREMHQRLTPESPVAVMRLRQINVDEDGALTTHYAFEIVDELQLPQKLAKRIFHVRSKVETLRFREGQFGGTHVPAQYWPFEIAPPLTTGVQPIYLKAAPETDIQHQLAWPWGLSALRVSIAYTQQAERDCVRVEKGVTGEISDAAIANGRAPTLWWQVPHHVVQYRSALRTNRTTAGLPDLFRAPAIRSMLPVLPDPPMPPIVASSLFSLTETELIKRWQPVLPGRLRYLLVGARAGVMFAVRNQLLRQVCSDPNPLEPQQGATLVSGSIPVQHRIPRPVPLPANEDPQHALQTWASYFEPTCNALVTLAPADEAFFAACDGRPAKRLRMVLREPNFGLLPNDWNGDLVFDIDPELDLLEEGDWGVTLQLTGAEEEYTLESVPHFSLTWSYAISDSKLRPGPVDEGLRQEFSQRGLELPKESAESEAPQLEVRPDPGYFVANIVYSGRNLYKLQREDGYLRVYGNRWRAKRRAALDLSAAATTSDGELILTASVTSNPPKGDTGASPAGFCQKLVFPLRLGDLTRPPLPLQPQFIHFEDPEYNRRLASSAALSNKNIRIVQKGDRKDYDLTLVADRKEYNPDSQVAILADWEPESDRPDVSLSLSLSRVDNTGNPTISDLQGLALEAGQLWSGSLADLTKDNQPLAFQPGNKVRIKVEVEGGKNATVEGSPDVLLEVDIVAEPVTPGPEAGYALLHAQSIDGHPEVECARFAWNPEPARIELVCAEDLKTEVVRRRAVFHWMHSSRPGRSSRYAIQKITHAGSTHFPQLDAS